MAEGARVLLTTEGTYPFHRGGVSTWCDTLVHHLSDWEYRVLAVAMHPYVQSQFSFPPNVREVLGIPLWGIQDPMEARPGTPFSEGLLKKRRTRPSVVQELFLPRLMGFLDEMLSARPDLDRVGEALTGMHRYFQAYDYKASWREEAVWQAFQERVARAVGEGMLPEPTVHEQVQALGWLYHFFIVLDVPLPDVDLVHASAAAFCGLVGVVAKREAGIPYLLTEHGVYLREQYLAAARTAMSAFSKRFLLALIRTVVQTNYRFADRIAPVCAFNARWEKILGAPADRIEVVYNGVSPEVFRPRGPEDAPGRSGITFVSVARSDPNKDLETLLRAMALVHRRLPEARLRVYGSVTVPDYHARILDLRRELGLEDVVELAGHTAEVAAVYREADVVVQSSVSEAFPYAIIEAMMSGCAVVATDVGGSAEALADAGLLVPARDPVRLAVGMLALATDPALRQQLGTAARARALSLFRRDRAIAAYARLYRRLVRKGLPPAEAEGRRLLHLVRAFALERTGQPVAALDQFWRALEADPGALGSAAILAEIAHLEWRLNRRRAASAHLIAAWLLQHRKRAA